MPNVYSLSATEYECIGAPPHVVKWLKEGVRLHFTSILESCFYSNRVFTQSHADFISKELTRLLSIDAIREVRYRPKCVLAMRAVPKKNGKLRLVTDCRPVNDHMAVPSLSQEGIAAVSDLILQDDVLKTIDVRDGFHHVPLCEEHQTYVGISWNGKYYVWTKLCFGLADAPYYFHKTIHPMIRYLRQQNVRLVPFVDNFLIMMKTSMTQVHKNLVLDTMVCLGWHPNYEKCDLSETSVATFVGFTINASTPQGPWIKVLPNKIRKLRCAIVKALHVQTMHVRALAGIAGQCVAMSKAIVPGKLLLRNIYRIIASHVDWNSQVSLNDNARSDLKWWLDALKGWNGAPLVSQPIDFQVEMDASSSGWGSKFRSEEATGLWSKQVSFKHSNYRELLAVLNTIITFREQMANKHIQVLSDNVVTCAYINHLGGLSSDLSNLMTTLWSTASKYGITLSARHLAGSLNGTANRLSHLGSPYDWHLHPAVFSQLDQMWVPHTVDRFAAAHNTHLKTYNSLRWDTNTSGIDALAQEDWNIHNNFVNPPLWLIPKVLKIIKQQEAHATLIAPNWHAQPWHQEMLSLLTTAPFHLPNNPRTFMKMSMRPKPWKNKKWQVYAWHLCGKKNCAHKVGQNIVKISL